MLTPLARLCVAHGLPFVQAEELFKQAFVRAAREARRESGTAASRDVSQVSITTGINRREVARITAELQPLASQRTSPASQVLLRWAANRMLLGHDGKPRPLPRSGPAPSFEALAQSVTRHVHPRSLLDELCRLGPAQLSDDGQTVSLLADRFVPGKDDERLFDLLGANVGDHLSAATAKVVHRDRRHFEQSLFTNEMSAESAAELRTVAQKLWAKATAAAIPEMERLMAEDKALGRPPTPVPAWACTRTTNPPRRTAMTPKTPPSLPETANGPATPADASPPAAMRRARVHQRRRGHHGAAHGQRQHGRHQRRRDHRC